MKSTKASRPVPAAQCVTIGIQGKGSSTIADMDILAPVIREKAGIELKTVSEDDVQRRLDWFRNGDIDLFYESSHIVAQNEGKLPAEVERGRGPLAMHILASAHSGACGYMVRNDSPIRTIHDIGPNTRVAICPLIADRVYGLLAWLNLNKGPIPDDPAQARWNVELVHFGSWEANLRSIEERRADVAVATPQNPIVKQGAAGPYGIRFLGLPARREPDGVRRFRRFFPFGELIPAPREGVKEIWGVTSMVGAACLWCRPDFDEGLDYRLTKCLDENYDLFKDSGNKLFTYTLEVLRRLADSAMAPIHSGTVRYFKEKGLWTAADEARQRYNRKLIDCYLHAWDAALERAGSLGIEVNSGNPAWLSLWDSYKKEAGIPGYRLMDRKEIAGGLRQIQSARL